MIALVTVFLVQVLARVLLGFDSGRYAALVEAPLALNASGFYGRMFLWQPLTYFWLSPLNGLLSIIFSLISIYFFGPPIELQLGGRRMLIAFISSGVAGGLLAMAVAGIFLRQSPLYSMTLIGTSAATSGLIATLCWWWRDRRLNLIIIQPLGWQLLAGFATLIVLQGLLSQPYFIVPELGGLLMGMAVGSNNGPYALFQRLRLWFLRRKIRSIRGGKDDRDWMN